MIIPVPKAALLGAMLLGLAVLVVVLATVDFDAWAIRRQSVRLISALHKPVGEKNPVIIAWRVRRLLGFFAQHPVLQPGEPLPAIQSREELTAVASRAFMASDSISVRVLDREIAWKQPRTEARMRLAVAVAVRLDNETRQWLPVYDVPWVREEGRWVIVRAHSTDSIRRPAALE